SAGEAAFAAAAAGVRQGEGRRHPHGAAGHGRMPGGHWSAGALVAQALASAARGARALLLQAFVDRDEPIAARSVALPPMRGRGRIAADETSPRLRRELRSAVSGFTRLTRRVGDAWRRRSLSQARRREPSRLDAAPRGGGACIRLSTR